MHRVDYISTAAEPSARGLFQLHCGAGACRLKVLHASEEIHERRAGTNPGYSEAGHRHSVFHIVLMRGGSAQFVHDARRCRAGAGQLLLCPPGALHEYRPVSPGRAHYRQVTFLLLDKAGAAVSTSFDALFAALGEAGHEFPDGPVVLSPGVCQLFEECFVDLLAALREGPGMLPGEARLACLFGLILRFVTGRPAAPTAHGGGLARALHHIERHFREPLSAADLAKVAGCSKGHFLREFKKRYGISPVACLQALRLTAARNLLRHTDLRISEIAAQTGFPDAYYFSRVFRLKEGCSPREFRRLGRGAADPPPPAARGRAQPRLNVNEATSLSPSRSSRSRPQ